jgi:hypothetical protein
MASSKPATGDFVEGYVAGHHNVSAFERRDQTLFDVGQESFAIHGSLDHDRRHDASSDGILR